MDGRVVVLFASFVPGYKAGVIVAALNVAAVGQGSNNDVIATDTAQNIAIVIVLSDMSRTSMFLVKESPGYNRLGRNGTDPADGIGLRVGHNSRENQSRHPMICMPVAVQRRLVGAGHGDVVIGALRDVGGAKLKRVRDACHSQLSKSGVDVGWIASLSRSKSEIRLSARRRAMQRIVFLEARVLNGSYGA
ncbi:hypothetical protein CMUS01_11116 [Colletotrichum musicola]|uniref:Uncharacterized protein n=1 Tax=Colletotrichum musicola TaxID=2175873 RepID=A0A8H6JZL7_9PEZI|nr:hypothetical protein CMUS01_11116 [Colletotrichum musicola]